ncbi:MAG: host attachment protein [Proteobacteria bacterium]|nr:host attachment protein [Pseudomonadota bacterium]MDA1058910.1 host attachment protein [Pseudomonadota bacterium]
MHNITTWVILADAGHARIVAMSGPGKGIEDITSFDAAEGRKAGSDLDSDRPGRRTTGRNVASRHAMEPHRTPKEIATEGFERTLTAYLEEAAKHKAFERLIVVAAPKVLGDLRRMLDGRIAIDTSLSKDLTHIATNDLEPHLRDIVNF